MNPDFYKKYFEVERNHWLMRVRRLIILDLLKKYNRRDKNKTKILDFGCGSGYFVGQLAEIGYQSFGLDNSVESIKFGEGQGIKNLTVTDGDRIDFPDNFFDCILLLDVLEHLENESPAIKEIQRVLSPGGIAIITVPAFKFLWGVQDEISHHYRRYRMPQLLNIAQQSGSLDIIFKSYFNAFLFFPIAAVRLFSKRFHIKNRESDFDINNRLLNRLFFFIFNIERNLLRHVTFPFGVSIVVVLRKHNLHEKA